MGGENSAQGSFAVPAYAPRLLACAQRRTGRFLHLFTVDSKQLCDSPQLSHPSFMSPKFAEVVFMKSSSPNTNAMPLDLLNLDILCLMSTFAQTSNLTQQLESTAIHK